MLTRMKQTATLIVLLSTVLLVSAADVTCPDGSTTAATMAECPCMDEAVMSNFRIATLGGSVIGAIPLPVNAVWGVTMELFFDYKVPDISTTAACTGTSFSPLWAKTFKWTVKKGNTGVTLRLATLPTTTKQRIVFPPWTFSNEETYNLTVEVTDQNDVIHQHSGTFKAVSPHPSGTVTCPNTAMDRESYPHMDHCKCAGDAEIHINPIENDNMPVVGGENWVDPEIDALFITSATYKTPSTFTPPTAEDTSNAHCLSKPGVSIEFNDALGVKWTLTDLQDNVEVTGLADATKQEVRIPVHTLKLGHSYTLSVNYTGFFDVYKTESVSFVADYRNVECPDGSFHGELRLCPCVGKAVFTTVITNGDHALPTVVQPNTDQTFTHSTEFKVPAGAANDGDVVCAGMDFSLFLGTAHLKLPKWIVHKKGDPEALAVAQDDSEEGANQLTIPANVLTAGMQYMLTITFFDALDGNHHKTVEFHCGHPSK